MAGIVKAICISEKKEPKSTLFLLFMLLKILDLKTMRTQENGIDKSPYYLMNKEKNLNKKAPTYKMEPLEKIYSYLELTFKLSSRYSI